jgi:uncharacterized UBP type Zn finger protein
LDVVAATCSHLDTVAVVDLPERIEGCEDCLRIGGRWLHLRMCLECGHIGCCDSSPNRHARKHAGKAGHPLVRSAEPGELWAYCFVDDVALAIDA